MSTQAVPQPQQQDPIISMVQDPRFATLPPIEQRKALAAHDPVFQRAGDDAIGQFIQAHQVKQSVIPKPTAPPTLTEGGQVVPEGGSGMWHYLKQAIPSGPDVLRASGLPGSMQEADQMVAHPLKTALKNIAPVLYGGPAVDAAIAMGKEGWRGAKGSLTGDPMAGIHIGSAMNPLAAPVVNAMSEQGLGTPQANAIGLVGAGQLALGKILASKAGAPPPTETEAISSIRRAVNPAPTDAGYAPGAHHGTGFAGELSDQIHTIVDHGQKTGLPTQLAQAKSPGEALNATAETVRSAAKADPYFKTYIEPNLNEVFPTSRIKGYSGGIVGEGNGATLAQLNSRLSTINDTLSPKYSRGGAGSVAAQSAVGAEQAASMQAEAAGIRMTIAQELSKRTGIPAEQIAGMRKNYGQLSDLADTIQSRANETLQQEFTDSNKRLKVKDVIPTVNNPAGVLGEIPLQRDPIINALRKGFSMTPNVTPQPVSTPPSVIPRPPSASRAALQTQTIPPRLAVDRSVLTPELMDALRAKFAPPQAIPKPARVPIWEQNASGESAASLEAQRRLASEQSQGIQRVRVDTRSGKEVPLIGRDAVDAKPGPFDRIVMRYPNGQQVVLDRGLRAR